MMMPQILPEAFISNININYQYSVIIIAKAQYITCTWPLLLSGI